MKVVVGDIVRMKTRFLYYCILSKASWEAKVKISVDALKEIEFWRKNVSILNGNGLSIEFVCASDVCNLLLYCDASDVGFGGYFETFDDENNENVFLGSVVGNWTADESRLSSTWRELEAVNRVMKSRVNFIQNQNLNVISDNKNVSKIMQVGSKKPYLQIAASQIFETCIENGVQVTNVWKPRYENKRADFLSRLSDMDDWSVHDDVFQKYEKMWGIHTIDRFATHYNKKCERFNSKYWCPGTEAIDAFTQGWVCENNWLVPPPSLISRVINKMLAEKASGLGVQLHVNKAVIDSGISLNSKLGDLSDHMCRYLLSSKSDSTNKAYRLGFQRWKTFINGHEQTEIPAQPVHVALYITHLLDSGASYSTVNNAIYSIKWMHEISGYSDPTENSFVKSLQESSKRLTGRPVRRKDPIDRQMLQNLCGLYTDSKDVLTLRNLSMILIGFCWFFEI
uniref:Uncharacterized protein LOC111132768 n=1 Tax=Crassostrea virginica TaxID=6565 RepID=A0A8B8E9N6_CRAVI|nr:uncharacterized protein LOC111132768 [Crassostrea virginica]